MKSCYLAKVFMVSGLFCLVVLGSPYATVMADSTGEEKVTVTDSGNAPSPMIRLGRSHFDPLKDRYAPKQMQTSRIAGDLNETGYYIVQFDGPIQERWKTGLMQIGATILDYVPDFAFSVRMKNSMVDAVRALAHVRWVGNYTAEYRLSNGALDHLHVEGGNAGDNLVLLRIDLFRGSDISLNHAAIQALGGTIVETSEREARIRLTVNIPAQAIADLSTMADVKWIEKASQWRLHNSVSTDIIDARAPRDTHGLYGQGQVVAVSDTGLDTGVIATLHNDFGDGAGTSRVNQIIDRTGTGASDVHSGHGTHVAGSVLGNGIESGSNPSADAFPDTSYAGLAPKANLIFQAIEDNGAAGNLSGIPADLNDLFFEAQSAGAHLHTNSWGAPYAGSYTASSEDVDQYMWNHKDYLILFSAGSNGVDMNGDGVVDPYSIEAPGTAKNCLTVGASEGYQPSGAGRDTTWGVHTPWVNRFSADPIASDHVSDNYDGMAATSSRGPTVDGRTKPDLVAPGSNILSTRSSLASGTGWGAFDAYYMWSGGTSTSAPLTAGAAAVMRQYLIDAEMITAPSAALLKAALLNSAEDISPGQYAGEIPSLPNSVAGWGRLNLNNALYPTAPMNILYYDEATGLATGQDQAYVIRVTDAGTPLKVHLVWTDYPGTPANQGGLVNDLDLQVTDPSAGVHYPDQAAQQSTITTVSYDSDTYANQDVSVPHAMRFTPSGADTYLESTSFAFFNDGADGGAAGTVDVVVYGDIAGRPDTASELFRKTLSFVPWTMITIPINEDMGSNDFHIAIEETDTTHLGLYVDGGSPPDDRSSFHNGGAWVSSSVTPYIRANMRAANVSDNFDRVNNAVGVTIDTPVAGDYTVRVTGYNVPQGGTQPFALIASGNVVEPSAGTVQFQNAAFSIDENDGSGTATITVPRTGGSHGAVSVDYATSNGTAAAGSDYTAASGTLTWTDGDNTAKTFTIAISDDSSDETDETVNLTLSNVGGNAVMGSPNTAQLTILDDDVAGSVQFSAATYSADEGAGTLTVTVQRVGGSDGAVSVDYASSNGTATAGTDYTATGSATLNWANGDNADKSFDITIVDDGKEEGNETLNVTLSNALGGATISGANPVVLTIRDNDAEASSASGGSGGGGGGGGCFIQNLWN